MRLHWYKNEIFDTQQVTGGNWAYITVLLDLKNPGVPKLNYTDFAQDNPTSDFGLAYGTICLFTTRKKYYLIKPKQMPTWANYDAAIKDINLFLSTRLTGSNPWYTSC